MPRVISRNFGRNEIPQSHSLPLKYIDLERCFSERSTEDVYLEVDYRGEQPYWKRERDALEREGRYRLLELDYNPEEPYFFSYPSDPWYDVESPILIHVKIYALPREVLTSAGLQRSFLKAALEERINRLIPHGLPSSRWHLCLTLLGKTRQIECESQLWDGLREGPKVKRLVVIR